MKLMMSLSVQSLQGLQKHMLRCSTACAIVTAPFVLFQAYGFWTYCLPTGAVARPGWCDSSIPYLYGHVQRKYWNVGLLRFYSWQQASTCTHLPLLPQLALSQPFLM